MRTLPEFLANIEIIQNKIRDSVEINQEEKIALLSYLMISKATRKEQHYSGS